MLESFNKIDVKKTNDNNALLLIKIYSHIKTLRLKNSISFTKVININIVSSNKYNINVLNEKLSSLFIHINKITPFRDSEIKELIIDNSFTIELLTTIVDKKSEIEKNEILLIKLKNELDRSTSILSNQNFIKKASKEKVALEENKQKEYMKQYEQVKTVLAELKK
jgi:valyl-tRNA synthetase